MRRSRTLIGVSLLVVATLAPNRGYAQASDAAADAASDGAPDDGPDAMVGSTPDARPEAGPAEVAVAAPPRTVLKLVVATKEAPPFAMKNSRGEWEGLSIELWRHIASELSYECEYHETDIRGMVEGLREGRYDAAVAAMTVTAEREALFDFTHPFYSTGLGIAVRTDGQQEWLGVLAGLFSINFLKPFLALMAVLLLVGLLVWLFERRKNAAQFGGSVAKGIGAGFWWSAVTMTTVGYGDKAPATIGGRVIGLIWMFVSVVTISGFTAAIASALTVSQLGSAIEGPDDLPRAKVGSIANTTSGTYLEHEHIRFRRYDSIPDGLEGLAAADIDAMVYDAPILQYYVARNRRLSHELRVLGETFDRQDYAIGLPANSPHREDINRVLLQEIGSTWWDDTIFRYLGP